jgi:hypothetical protein
LTGGGGVAFTGKLTFFPALLSMSNARGDDSGTTGAGGAFAGAAYLKPLGGGSSGTGVDEGGFDGDWFMIAVGRGGGDSALRTDSPVWGVGDASGGDFEGGRAMAPKTFGTGDKSLLEGPACGDDNNEVFPGGAGGGDMVKLSSVGVVPK